MSTEPTNSRRDEVAKILYKMNGRQWYGRDLGGWDDPESRIGRNQYERDRWLSQADALAIIIADAWDEGFSEGLNEDIRVENGYKPTDNPYKNPDPLAVSPAEREGQ